MKPCFAVLDIGKTNKKLLIYDQELNILEQKKQQIPEITIDGILREDLDQILTWFKDQLRKYAKRYPIHAISISSHGATFVGLDKDGHIPIPVISYTHDPGASFQDRFFNEYGDRDVLQETTATPHLGALINPGKGLFFQKERFPEDFNRIETFLYYPQFFGYWLTGNIGADITYTGCHTYLWNFREQDYSSVSQKMGIAEKLPYPVQKPYEVLGKLRPDLAKDLGLSSEVVVTMGIHDSNSALLPYLVTQEQDFILNSTGTWCVVMHPEQTVNFNEDEIGKTVFYNLSAFGDPVKTTIFMGGLEFEMYDKVFKKAHGDLPFPEFDPDLYYEILDNCQWFILPSLVQGSGQFPDSEARVLEKDRVYPFSEIERGAMAPSFFKTPEKAYAVLNISLALQTKVALDRAGMHPGMPIFVEGGFRNNKPYCKLLTALYPDSKLFLTNLEEASAFGAAICAKAALEDRHPADFKNDIHIEMELVKPVSLSNIENYYNQFIRFISTG